MSDLTVSVREAAALEGWTREYGYRHFKRFFVKSEEGEVRVPLPALSPDAKTRWFKAQAEADLLAAGRPAPLDAKRAQGNLFPILDADREAAAAIPDEADRQQAFRRLALIQPSNHDYAALGFANKTEFERQRAKAAGISLRTYQDYKKRYAERGLSGLVDATRGPQKGAYGRLEAWEKAFLTLEWRKSLNFTQCLRSLNRYIEAKRNSPDCRASYRYETRTPSMVYRFLSGHDAISQAAREGPDKLKAACGHIDRSYLDLASLERVESDEVKLNVFSYDPRRPLNRKGEPWIRRYWLLTFYDARAIFPLVWTLCEGSEYELRHGIAVEDEINLFVALVREFGVPKSIHSDRGRFRGREWGGEPYQQRIDKEFAPVNGILQRVGKLASLADGIRHDMPRVHNPRDARLERFHRWVADWFRGKPGWTATIKERKQGLTPRGDEDARKHALWCVGKLAPGEPSPLLTRDEILVEVGLMMEEWRDHNSEGTDMNGCTPRAVFNQCSPRSGFPRISENDLAFATAQQFENQQIRQGGIIELRKGERYSHPLLAGLAGERREVVRLRHDHTFVWILPAAKGEEKIAAPRRVRVGMHDPDELARQMELQKRLEKLAGAVNKPLEYEPGEAPEPCEPAPQAPPPAPDSEISSVEFLMENERYQRRVKALDFADLEE